MGKNASKHECFLVNAHLNKAWEEQIWKKTTKTGYNLANYNMNQSMSELSICLEDKQENTDMKDNNKENNVELKVELPPIKSENGKMFTFDKGEEMEKGEKEQESRLNIEEFECGVHFGGGEKQEWSFTLYDFDGHGKITKEDLVGLLKALYDAIGSSIKIPSNGTKTLKLRLSVGQEPSSESGSNSVAAGKVEKDGEEKDANKNTPKKKDNSKHKENIKQKDSPKSKVKDISRLNNLVGGQSMPAKCNNNDVQSQCTAKSRLSTQKHKELASLVQENMERNHIRALRRHHSDCHGCLQEQKPQKRRQRTARTTNSAKDNNMKQYQAKSAGASPDISPQNAAADDTPKESQDRRNYYLDLAGVENTTSKFQDTPTTALTNGKCLELNNSQANTSKFQPVKPYSALSNGRFYTPKHFRSRSHEMADKKCDNAVCNSEQCNHVSEEQPSSMKIDHLRSRSFDPQDSSVSNIRAMKGNPLLANTQKQSRFRPISLPPHIPETVSPHYHRRHRHREKDHDMAMQQVAEWIEREHTVDYEGDKVVIQRHEHHHVHEHHHHHHYHHYYEA